MFPRLQKFPSLSVLRIHPDTFIPLEVFMLVLSRKQNERIRVGDSVVVTVVRVSGDKVRIGIEAPPHVRVLRDELEDNSLGAVTLEESAQLSIPRLFGFTG
jgi:carbon storage regulator